MGKLVRAAVAVLTTAAVGTEVSRLLDAAPPAPPPETCATDVQVECIDVQASTPALNQQPPLVGLLNAGSSPANAAAARGLRPDFWRVGFQNMLGDAKQSGAPIEFVLSDGWNFGPGAGHPPWWNDKAPDWSTYDQYVLSTVHSLATSPTPPVWWDISNEERRGTVAQRVEMFIRTELLIRSVLPDASIVGMSQPEYDQNQFRQLLSSVSQQNAVRQSRHLPPIVFNAVSWHEMGDPSAVQMHVNQFQNLVSLVNLHGMPHPSIQINEYLGPQDVNRPGAVVSWLQELQVSGVARAAHACWSDAACNTSLDGLLDDATLTPRPEYWVYWDYARMLGTRMETHTYEAGQGGVGLSAVATKDPSRRTVKVLIGQYSTVAPRGGLVRVAVTGYNLSEPGQEVKATIQRISAAAPNSISPPSVSTQSVKVSSGRSLVVDVRGYLAGDAYVLTIGG